MLYAKLYQYDRSVFVILFLVTFIPECLKKSWYFKMPAASAQDDSGAGLLKVVVLRWPTIKELSLTPKWDSYIQIPNYSLNTPMQFNNIIHCSLNSFYSGNNLIYVLSKNEKNNVYPSIPHFFLHTVRFKWVLTTCTCKCDEELW